MANNLFVGGFPYETSEEELGRLFAACGKVSSVKILMDRATGRSRGIGFVVMATDAEAQVAIKKLDGSKLGSRQIFVNEARPQEEKPRSFAPRSGPAAAPGFVERRSGKDRRQSGAAPSGERRSWGEKKPWGDKPRDKKPWEKKPWDKMPGGRFDKPRPVGDKPAEPGAEKKWEKKPWEKKPWGDKKPWVKKPWDKKPEGGPAGEKKWEKKPWGKKPGGFGGKPGGFAGKKKWSPKPGGFGGGRSGGFGGRRPGA